MVQHAPTHANDVRSWQDKAACYPWDFKKHGDPFFPTGRSAADAQKAQSICAGCPVQIICKQSAFESRDTMHYGIFGGTTPEDRTRSKRKHDRAERENRKARAS